MPRRSIRDGSPPNALDTLPRKESIWNKFSIGSWLNKDSEPLSSEPEPLRPAALSSESQRHALEDFSEPQPSTLAKQLSWKVVTGQPRPITATRQDSERRDNLIPHHLYRENQQGLTPRRRRAASATRDQTPTQFSRIPLDRHSAPDTDPSFRAAALASDSGYDTASRDVSKLTRIQDFIDSTSGDRPPAQPPPPPLDDDLWSQSDTLSEDPEDVALQAELQRKWILNLSMRFKDRTDREKFFITYAEQPNKWRRVTVSCDYRDAPEDSLEADLRTLPYQREKNARIYESIRKSLPAIQFYDTVTNLKLETSEHRLHVHVTEDVNEIIKYPSLSAVKHLRGEDFKVYPESDVCFDSHLSGFVYKVTIDGQIFIKKEIPSPDTVEEFLYEINSLYRLRNCQDIIRFGGIIVDDSETVIKGLLIAYAEAGALVDIIYDQREYLPWRRRKKWAMQIIRGLSDIHEHGFVQGDFTLSNIVIDAEDNAKIIDINRRGCPLGWEPPEFDGLISSGQRISMYIGIKSDMFQLGMVLWGLGMEDDEPEHRPKEELLIDAFPSDVPEYFKVIVQECLETEPQSRTTASRILARHLELTAEEPRLNGDARPTVIVHEPTAVVDVDPATTVTLADIEASKRLKVHMEPPKTSLGNTTYALNSPSTRYQYFGNGEDVIGLSESPINGCDISSASSALSFHSKTDRKQVQERMAPTKESRESSHTKRGQSTTGLALRFNSSFQPEDTNNWLPDEPLPSHSALQEALSSGNDDPRWTTNAESFHPSTREWSTEPEPLLADNTTVQGTSIQHDRSVQTGSTVEHSRYSEPTSTLPPPLHHDSGFDEAFADMIQEDSDEAQLARKSAPKSPPTPEALAAPPQRNDNALAGYSTARSEDTLGQKVPPQSSQLEFRPSDGLPTPSVPSGLRGSETQHGNMVLGSSTVWMDDLPMDLAGVGSAWETD